MARLILWLVMILFYNMCLWIIYKSTKDFLSFQYMREKSLLKELGAPNIKEEAFYIFKDYKKQLFELIRCI